MLMSLEGLLCHRDGIPLLISLVLLSFKFDYGLIQSIDFRLHLVHLYKVF